MHKSLFFLLSLSLLACQSTSQSPLSWPALTAENKPWTRWWWHGSAVSPDGIRAELQAYQAAGIGGMEITPIYGVRGEEEQFVPFLSPPWEAHLSLALQEAQKLGMGIDMATGTGWPFGGPWVAQQDASKYLVPQVYELASGQRLNEKVVYLQEAFVRAVNRGDLRPEALDPQIEANANLQSLAIDQVRFAHSLPLISLMAYGENGESISLIEKVKPDSRLDWVAPEGKWTLYAVFQGQHGKMVERAAPGGEGYVIDHFSQAAIQDYLQAFDQTLDSRSLGGLRAFFNDSYEVDDARGQANFTPDLLEEFKSRKGYDLQAFWPALFGQGEETMQSRVLSDYREVISDLLLETFTREWKNWAGKKNKLIRNQAHGSPANILDLYAEADIPETEGTELVRIKFATSAGHVTGKKLISAEAATWLNEHFVSDLGELKENLDRYFVGGVNHLFYHGSCYSPPGDPWPGRLFYAAIHANPRNSLWPGFTPLNQYIGRTQSFLQQGQADNDILLYFPVYDRFATPTRELLDHFDGHGPVLEQSAFKAAADQLLEKGFAFDYLSDRQLAQLATKGGQIRSSGGHYQVLLVPPTEHMPLASFQKLLELAEQGATVLFMDQLPTKVPGMSALSRRTQELAQLTEKLSFSQDHEGIEVAPMGKGKVGLGKEVESLLQSADVFREEMVELGLQYTRRSLGKQTCYFISNWSGKTVDRWVRLQRGAQSVAILAPMTGQIGLAQVQDKTASSSEILLQLAHGESCLLLLSPDPLQAEPWPYSQPAGEKIPLDGTWEVSFLQGGPTLPNAYETDRLASWTQQEGTAYQQFSGTARFQLRFPQPKEAYPYYLLSLGEVKETAAVYLNGKKISHLLGPVFQCEISAAQLEAQNLLEIKVSNLMANRIAALDQAKVPWKKFYNINFAARKAENRNEQGLFDATDWAPRPSGLLGPVYLQGRTLK